MAVPDVALRNPALPTAEPAVPRRREVALPATSVVNVPAAGVDPPMAPGDGKDVTFAVPLKFDPPMVRVFSRDVAVAAFPEHDPLTVELTAFPEVFE